MYNKYPKKLFRSVLLLDGKIIGWKTSPSGWSCVLDALHSIHGRNCGEYGGGYLSVCSESSVVHSDNEWRLFFEDNSFYEQFDIHEKFKGFKPYTVESDN